MKRIPLFVVAVLLSLGVIVNSDAFIVELYEPPASELALNSSHDVGHSSSVMIPPAVSSSVNSSTGIDSVADERIRLQRSNNNSGGDVLSSHANILSRGEVVQIDRAANRVLVRNASTGVISSFPINDHSLFQDLRQGDQVQVFTDTTATP